MNTPTAVKDTGKPARPKGVHPRGTGDRNLTNAEIRDKYAKLTHRAISAERQAAIEKLSSVSTLSTTRQGPLAQLSWSGAWKADGRPMARLR